MASDYKRLWAPWRLEYVSSDKAKSDGCIFCDKPKQAKDKENGILAYSKHSFVILNRYPYVNGHIMAVPFKHIQSLGDLSEEESVDFFNTVKTASQVIEEAYHPAGMNIGMNIGVASGAGIAEHLHCHILPRWIGDTSFMTVISDVRMIMETLEITYDRLKPLFTEKLGEKKS